MQTLRPAAFVLAAALAFVSPSQAQSVADFYKGKQLTMIKVSQILQSDK